MSNKQKIADATWALQQLDVTGNIIPHQWFNSIKMENGSPDFHSIILLSEIVYWYKPKNKFNEKGIQVGITKKYSEDLLQKSYDDLSEKFGMTKRQVRDAIVRLEKRGLVEREFRNLVVRGMAINNVLYIKLFVDKLKEYTLSDMTDSNDGVTDSNTSECSNSSEGVLVQGYTYTETTTKTTTDIKNNIPCKQDDIDYEGLVNYLNFKTNKNYKHTTKKTRALIKDRINDGFTLQDFKTVIDKKCEQWLNDGYWNTFLRPETLFGNKFEGYLNQADGSNKPQKKLDPWEAELYEQYGREQNTNDNRIGLPAGNKGLF